MSPLPLIQTELETRSVSHRGAKGIYAPDEIQKSMFVPLMKKALMGGIRADAKTSLSLNIIRYSAIPSSLVCYARGA